MGLKVWLYPVFGSVLGETGFFSQGRYWGDASEFKTMHSRESVMCFYVQSPEEVGFGQKPTPFGDLCRDPAGHLVHFGASIVANFNDFAFLLGMTIFHQVGLKLQQRAKPVAVWLSPLATPHFNHWVQWPQKRR